MRRLLATLLVLAACGPDEDAPKADAGPGGGTSDAIDVEYTVTCSEVLCPGADDAVFRVDSGTCSWRCADYEGQRNRQVILDFVRRAGCWEFRIASVGDGICE